MPYLLCLLAFTSIDGMYTMWVAYAFLAFTRLVSLSREFLQLSPLAAIACGGPVQRSTSILTFDMLLFTSLVNTVTKDHNKGCAAVPSLISVCFC